jgi:hypothetical protein
VPQPQACRPMHVSQQRYLTIASDLSLCTCSGLSLTAKIARQEGGGIRDWLSPSLHIHVEPLGLL